MSLYSTFDLTISSCFPLSLPDKVGGKIDIDITVDPSAPPIPEYEWVLSGSPHCLKFFWAEAGWFTIKDGNSISVSPIEHPGDGVIEDSILGECLGVLLIQRNELVLHASAIETNGGAFIFSGESGLGKSSLASIALQEGGAILADDLTLIRMVDGVPCVIPGPSWLKVRAAALHVAGLDPNLLPVAFDESEKFRVEGVPAVEPVPIKHLALLEEGGDLNLTPCPKANAFLGLMENSFAAHIAASYEYDFMDNGMRRNLFEACESLLQSVPVSILTRGRSIPSPTDLAALFNEQSLRD